MTYDVTYIKGLYDASFSKCKNDFKNILKDYQNSYFKKCGDWDIVRIKQKLNDHYNRINRIYDSIDSYWEKYLNDVSNTDEFLAGNAKIGSIYANFTRQRLSSLPELETYNDNISIEVQNNVQTTQNIQNVDTENLEIEDSNKLETFWNRLTDWFSSIFGDVQDKIEETGAEISGWFSSFVLDVNSKLSDDAIIVNVKNLADENLDREFPSKTTLAMVDGTRIEYEEKIEYSDGSIEYFDKDGNLIKKIYANGTVETYYNDDHYIFNPDGTFNIINNITSNFGSISDENFYYDSNGKLIKRVTDHGSGPSRIDYYNGVEAGDYLYRGGDGDITELIDKNGNIYRRYENVYDNSGNYLYRKKTEYYENGQIKSIEAGDGNITEYNEDGNTLLIEKDNNVIYRASYYDNGNIEAESDIKNNIYKKYYDNGNIKEVSEPTDGTDGYEYQSTRYSEDGTLRSIINYPDAANEKKYTQIAYDKNGQIYSIYNRDNDVSTTEYYNENGNTYMRENADGVRKYYDENGNFEYEMKANEHGMKYAGGIRTFYDENGNVTRSYSDP